MSTDLSVTRPTFEHVRNPLGLGTATPRVSWRTQAAPDWRQAGYELRVGRGGAERVFRVDSGESVLVSWHDAPLASREEAAVAVRVIGADGSVSSWSDSAAVEAGLLDPLDWWAAGIAADWPENASDARRRPPLLRHEFELPAAPVRARLYATAHGLYELELNGRRVSDDALAPGWTAYRDRLRYQSYDVTDALAAGPNAIGAWLGDGWWRGRLGFHGGHLNLFGTDLALLAQLEVECADGTVHRIGTGRDWLAHPSPILHANLYDGETFDARELIPGWSEPGLDTAGWSSVRGVEFAAGTLVAPDGPPVRCTEELAPVSVERRDDGRLIVDFGQNFAGRVRLVAASGVSSELTIRHAEVLQDGELYVRTLRQAQSTDRHLGSGGGIDWEPRFTIHGFRYAEITGYEGDPAELTIIGRVYHSDMQRTGWLTTSNEELNRLHENVVWSMRSNFVDVPTDCPQRDERLGWTGDIQVFAPTASFLCDCAGFLSGWLKDVAVEQRRHGTVPWYVPVIPGDWWWTPIRPGAVWGDVAVLTPAVVHDRFGDLGVLAQQYESVRAWVDQVDRLAGPSHLWDTGMQLGDWLDPAAPPEDPAKAVTDPYLVATAYFASSASRLAEIARLLQRETDAAHYAALAEAVRAAFVARWCDAEGNLLEPTQTGLALSIVFELLPDPVRAGDALAALVAERGNRIGVGFAGVNLVSDALSRTGHLAEAYALLLEPATPSWLSMVRKGATTIWERWDSLLDDGTVNPGEMTSFNHYALGSIADWMHRVIGGIAPLEAGYRRVLVAPHPGGGLTSAVARFDSPYGTIESSWHLDEGGFALELTLPTGTTAEVRLPDGTVAEAGPGRHEFRAAA
jgi:alpha-L-rhamnosidase